MFTQVQQKKSGGRKLHIYGDLTEAKVKKNSLINIRCEPSLGGALIMGMARQETSEKGVKAYQLMKNANRRSNPKGVKAFQAGAALLHRQAGVPTAPTGIENINKFIPYVAAQIKVWALLSEPVLLFASPARDKIVHLLYEPVSQHYDIITSPAGFFGFKYYYSCCDLLTDTCDSSHTRQMWCPQASVNLDLSEMPEDLSKSRQG